MVNDRAAIALSMLRAHNIMNPRVNEQETCGACVRAAIIITGEYHAARTRR
jgi:hypothetical protein